MGVSVEHRKGIQVAQHEAVLAVRQRIHTVFESVADVLDVLIALLTEEHMHIVREASQVLRAAVFLAVCHHLFQHRCQFAVVRVVDNHLLAHDVTLGSNTPQLAEEIAISIHVEHHRVVVRLHGEERTDWCQHHGTHPHAHHRRDGARVCQVVAQRVDDVIEDEDYHSHHHRHSQSTLADDGTERRTDEEEDKTCQGERDFLPNLYLVHSLLTSELVHHFHLELHVEVRQVHLLQGALHHIHALHVREVGEERVDVHSLHRRFPFPLRLSLLSQFRLPLMLLVLHGWPWRIVGHVERSALHVVGVGMRRAVNQLVDGVDALFQLVDALGASRIGEVSIAHLEVLVEVDDEMLLHESLATVRHIVGLQGIIAQVLELLTIKKVQNQVLLVGTRLQPTRIGKDDVGIVHTVAHVVDDAIVEHTRLLVLVVHIEIHALHPIVEHALGNVQFGRLLANGEQQRHQLLLRIRCYHVLHMIAPHRENHHQDCQRPHGAHQRDASRLDSQQLQALTHVSERNEGCQQDGNRQRQRDESFGGIEEELGKDGQFQTLSHQVVHIFPKELHHNDEQTDHEGAQQHRNEVLQNIYVKFLDETHLLPLRQKQSVSCSQSNNCILIQLAKLRQKTCISAVFAIFRFHERKN